MLRSELDLRLKKVRNLMQKERLDAVIVHSSDHFQAGNLRWVSNFDLYAPSALIIIPKKGELSLITGFNPNYIPRMKATTWIGYVKAATQPFSYCKKALSRISMMHKRFGLVGGQDMPYYINDPLRKEFNGTEFVDVTPWFEEVRRMKSDEELTAVRKAARIADTALRTAKSALRAGIRESEVVAEACRSARLAGCDLLDRENVLMLVASGPDAVKTPRSVPSTRVLQEKDSFLLALGVQYEGYWAWAGRTFCLGKPMAQQEEIHRAVLAAQETAISFIKPAVSGERLAEKASMALDEASPAAEVWYAYGHGLGLDTQERPLLQEGEPMKLQTGMVLRVGIAAAIPQKAGALIFDTVVVTKDGAESLTTSRKNLMVVK